MTTRHGVRGTGELRVGHRGGAHSLWHTNVELEQRLRHQPTSAMMKVEKVGWQQLETILELVQEVGQELELGLVQEQELVQEQAMEQEQAVDLEAILELVQELGQVLELVQGAIECC